jgi:predicted outer membrane repeat protein
MRSGKISGNTATDNGGGVYVATNAAFTMYSGEISGNTAGNAGAGVYLQINNATFTMYGGTISGNKNTGSYGGGVQVSTNATFRSVAGPIYGSNAAVTTLRNTSGGSYASMFGSAQRGTFSGAGGEWVSSGNLTSGNNTIKVVEGVLQ